MLIKGEAPCASTKGMLETEQFLQDNYVFRQNVLNGKVEFAEKASDGGSSADFMPLTPQALNSIIIRALREDISEKGNPQTEIKLLVQSNEVPQYNPIQDFLNNLPQWDGQNHVARLFFTTARHQFRAVRLPDRLAALGCGSLAADGHAAR